MPPRTSAAISRQVCRVGGQRGVGLAPPRARGGAPPSSTASWSSPSVTARRMRTGRGPGSATVSVVAADQLGQHRDDAGLLRSGHLGHLPTIAQPKVTSIRSRLASRRAPNPPVAPRGRRRGPRGVGIGRCRRSLAVAVRRVAARPRDRVVGARALGDPRARVHRRAGRDRRDARHLPAVVGALGARPRLGRGVAGERRDARRVAGRGARAGEGDLAGRPHRRARDDRRRRVGDRDDGARARGRRPARRVHAVRAGARGRAAHAAADPDPLPRPSRGERRRGGWRRAGAGHGVGLGCSRWRSRASPAGPRCASACPLARCSAR